jgi:ArsR family transcriptional regulator, arsenate/arsenite/antimonite-responsive transcriptional repressor
VAQFEKTVPQGLKPTFIGWRLYGTAEAVPSQSNFKLTHYRCFAPARRPSINKRAAMSAIAASRSSRSRPSEGRPGGKPARAAGARLPKSRRVAMLKALADPHRFALLEQIARAGCPLGCAQARAALPISAATLSHHIKELETAGLIEVRRAGKFAYLSLRPGVLAGLAGALAALESPACPAG